MRATVTADARKLSALTRNPNGAPNAAMSTPAAAGPTVSDAVWTALSVAFADRRCSSGDQGRLQRRHRGVEERPGTAEDGDQRTEQG